MTNEAVFIYDIWKGWDEVDSEGFSSSTPPSWPEEVSSKKLENELTLNGSEQQVAIDEVTTNDGDAFVAAGSSVGVFVTVVTSAGEFRDLTTLNPHVPGNVLSVACRGDISAVFAAHLGNTLLLYKLEGNNNEEPLVLTHSHQHTIQSVALSKFFAVSASRILNIHDVVTGDLIHTLVGHEDLIEELKFFESSQRLASVGCDKTLRVWDLGSEKPRCLVILKHPNIVLSVEPVSDTCVITSCFDGCVRVYEQEDKWKCTKKTRVAPEHVQHAFANGLAFDRSTGAVYAVSEDGSLLAFEIGSSHEVRTTLAGATGLCAISLSPDGRCIVTRSTSGRVNLWSSTVGARFVKSARKV